MADVSGREITVPDVRDSAAGGGTALVARAIGAEHRPPLLDMVEVSPIPNDGYEEGFRRYLEVFAAMHDHLPLEAYG